MGFTGAIYISGETRQAEIMRSISEWLEWNGKVGRSMFYWVDEWMSGWVDKWMDGWMDGCMDG